MWRPILIVGMVGVLMATGAALAAPTSETRLPVTMSEKQMPTSGQSDEVVVSKGDHLWKISERRVSTISPGQAIAPYWLRVIEANVSTLRSGDPDLIFPGEVIRLPEISEPP